MKECWCCVESTVEST